MAIGPETTNGPVLDDLIKYGAGLEFLGGILGFTISGILSGVREDVTLETVKSATFMTANCLGLFGVIMVLLPRVA